MDKKHTTEWLTNQAVMGFNQNGFFVHRQNNVGVYDKNTDSYRFNGMRGVPDIIGFDLAKGRFVGVEIKTGSDRVRPDQQKYLDRIKASGGLALVVRSTNDLKFLLEPGAADW